MIDIHEMKVLIEADMITMSKSIHKMMKLIRYEHNFFFAYNGKEALNILQKDLELSGSTLELREEKVAKELLKQCV